VSLKHSIVLFAFFVAVAPLPLVPVWGQPPDAAELPTLPAEGVDGGKAFHLQIEVEGTHLFEAPATATAGDYRVSFTRLDRASLERPNQRPWPATVLTFHVESAGDPCAERQKYELTLDAEGVGAVGDPRQRHAD